MISQVSLALCLAVAITVVSAQYRPSYFPRPGGFSQVLPQYANNQPGGSDSDIGNRDNAPPPPGNGLEDTQQANRVQEWPRPNQPFWFINQQHIAQHTGQTVPAVGRS